MIMEETKPVTVTESVPSMYLAQMMKGQEGKNNELINLKKQILSNESDF